MNAFNYPTFSVDSFVELRRRGSCSPIVLHTYGTYPSGGAAKEALNREGPPEQCFFFKNLLMEPRWPASLGRL